MCLLCSFLVYRYCRPYSRIIRMCGYYRLKRENQGNRFRNAGAADRDSESGNGSSAHITNYEVSAGVIKLAKSAILGERTLTQHPNLFPRIHYHAFYC